MSLGTAAVVRPWRKPHVPTALEQAAAAFEAGRFDEAAIRFGRVAVRDPTHRPAHFHLAVASLRCGRLDEAEVAARKLVALAPELGTSHGILAAVLWKRGDLVQAVRTARRAARIEPDHEGSTTTLIQILLDAGRDEEAARELRQAAVRGVIPDSEALTLWMTNRGVAEMENGTWSQKRLRDLVRKATRALDENPVAAEPLGKLARASLLGGDPRTAADVLERAARHRSLTAGEACLLGAAYGRLGSETAESALARARQAGASDLDVARMEQWAGRFPAAFDRLDVACNKAGENVSLSLLRERVRAGLRMLDDPDTGSDRRERARAAATSLLVERPQDTTALRLLVRVALDRGEPATALEWAKKLAQIDSVSPRASWLEGRAYLDLGRPSSALHKFREGRGAVPEETADLWVLRAALRAVDRPTIRETLPSVRGPGATALRSAAHSALGEPERGELLARSVEFASCPMDDRVRAAVLLCVVGRKDTATALADQLADTDEADRRLLRADLLAGLRRDAEANELYEELTHLSDDVGQRARRRLAGRGSRVPTETPTDPESIYLAGLAALARADAQASRRYAERLREHGAESSEHRVFVLRGLAAGNAPRLEIDQAVALVRELDPWNDMALRAHADSAMTNALRSLRGGVAEFRELGRVGDLDPDPARGALLRGVALLGQGEIGEVERLARELSSSQSTRADGQLLRAWTLAETGDDLGAAQLLDTVARAFPHDPAVLGYRALAWARAAEPEQALAAARDFVRQAGADPRARCLLAAALDAAGDPDEARRLLDNVVSEHPDDMGPRILSARLRLAHGQEAAAMAELDAVVAKSPAVVHAYSLQVMIHLGRGRTAEALRVAERAAAVADLGVNGHLLVAHVAKATGDDRRRRSALQAAVSANPKSAVAHHRTGQLEAADGHLDAARDAFLRAVSLAPHDGDIRLSLALLEARLGNDSSAVARYREVLERDPKSAVAANNLAFRLLDRLGNFEYAVALARTAVARRPDTGEFHDTLARALASSGDLIEAETVAAKARDLLPDRIDVAILHAQLLRRNGRASEAREAFRAALTLDPPRAEADLVRQELKRLAHTTRDPATGER